MTNKKKLLIGGGVVVFVGAMYFLYEHFMFVTTDNAYIEAHTVLLAPKVPAYILEAGVIQGQKVKKGEILVKLDNRDYVAALESAKSELASLEARRSDAEKNFRRLRDLYSKNVVSSQQFDTAQAGYNEVKARYDATSAKVQQAQLNLDSTEIKAPSDGIVARASAEVGQLAAPGAPLVGFVSSENRWITANFKETEIEGLKIGQKAEISVDALSKKSFEGEIESISSATGSTFTLLPPDNATGNFTKVVQRVPVRIKFNGLSNADYEQIQAGLSAIVKVKVH